MVDIVENIYALKTSRWCYLNVSTKKLSGSHNVTLVAVHQNATCWILSGIPSTSDRRIKHKNLMTLKFKSDIPPVIVRATQGY